MNFVCLNFVCMNFGGLGADTELGGPRDPPVQTLAVLHHMHRARHLCGEICRCASHRGMLGVVVAVFRS